MTKLTLTEQTITLPSAFVGKRRIRLSQIMFDTKQGKYLKIRCPPIAAKLSQETCDVIALANVNANQSPSYQSQSGSDADWIILPENTLLDRYFYLAVFDDTEAPYTGKFTAILDFMDW